MTRCMHAKGGVDLIMSKFNILKNNVHKIKDAHLKGVNNKCSKYEYKQKAGTI